jgi:Bacterial Ig domain
MLVTASTLAIAAPASASGVITVNLVGAGHVTGEGIDCTRTSDGVTSGTCAHFVEDHIGDAAECQPADPPCVRPGSETLRATPVAGSGFVFDRFSGFCLTTNPCTIPVSITIGSNSTFTATFLDVQPPTVSVTEPADGAAVAGRIQLSASAADNGLLASVAFRVGGTLLPSLVAPPFTTVLDTQTLPDGPSAITATATDGASRSTISAARNITIDNTKPTLTLTGPDGTTFGPGQTPTWTIAAADAAGPPTVRCSAVPVGRPVAFGACTSATTERLPNQPDGRYTLTVRASDRAGNVADQQRAFAVDTGPPETTIASGPDDGSSSDGATITWGLASSEVSSTFECRVFASATAPTPFGSCTSATQHSVSDLSPGMYSFEVRATDAVGNVDASPARRTVVMREAPGADAGAVSGQDSGTVSLPDTVAPPTISAPPTVISAPAVLSFGLSYHYRKLDARATVTARCPTGCARKRLVTAPGARTVSLRSLLKKALRVKTRITVTVSRPGAVSVVKVLEIRSRKPPRITTLCIPPGTGTARTCA